LFPKYSTILEAPVLFRKHTAKVRTLAPNIEANFKHST
jgi:hypothetical protein